MYKFENFIFQDKYVLLINKLITILKKYHPEFVINKTKKEEYEIEWSGLIIHQNDNKLNVYIDNKSKICLEIDMDSQKLTIHDETDKKVQWLLSIIKQHFFKKDK